MTGLEVAILTHDETHCGHVPCRPPSPALWGCRCLLWWGKQHAIVVFRIKWVWIWLELSDTRVSSRGAFFGRIDYPRFQKKTIFEIASSFLLKTSHASPLFWVEAYRYAECLHIRMVMTSNHIFWSMGNNNTGMLGLWTLHYPGCR